jgi:hypothetical protein
MSVATLISFAMLAVTARLAVDTPFSLILVAAEDVTVEVLPVEDVAAEVRALEDVAVEVWALEDVAVEARALEDVDPVALLISV